MSAEVVRHRQPDAGNMGPRQQRRRCFGHQVISRALLMTCLATALFSQDFNNNASQPPAGLPRCLSTAAETSAPADLPYLQNLFVSHGSLNFSPEKTMYRIPLASRFETLEVVPVLDTSKYKTGDHPLLHVGIGTGSKTKVVPGIGTSLDIRPYSGSYFDVIVEVLDKSRGHQDAFVQYKLTFDESQAPPSTLLKEMTVTDQDGDKLELSPLVQKDAQKYTVFSQAKTTSMIVTGRCEDDSQFLVNGSSSGSLSKDTSKASQLIKVECRNSSSNGKIYSRTYFLEVRTQLADLQPPSQIVVQESGKACQIYDKSPVEFSCETDYSTATFIATSDPRFRYTITNGDGSVKVRLLNNEPTAAVPCSSGLYIHGTAGHSRDSKKWPLKMTGVFFPQGGDAGMQAVGLLLGILLLLSLLSLLFVLTISNIFGMGSPFGASEVPSTLTFLLQFFCFGNVMRGAPTVLGDMTTVLKWVTLWWPLPWSEDGEVSVAHVENAEGCLFWCGATMLGCLLLHFLLWLRFRFFLSQNTYPHKMRLGHWESRAVHFLCFPAATASTMLLCHSDSSPAGRVLGFLVLAATAAYSLLSFAIVKRAVKSRSVVWIWNQSLRDNEEEVETGYWSDARCDQLHTEPANRSLCRQLFPWRWTATVADILPVNLLPEDASSSSSSRNKSAGSLSSTVSSQEEESALRTQAFPKPRDYPSSSSQDLPTGKSPRTVTVHCTRAPNKFCCRGQKLVVGLFRTNWVDILFTYDSLTMFFSYAVEHDTRQQTQLTVKSNQLTGPVSGGYLCFFFDGVRIPFLRSAEFVFRALVGVMLGTALAVSVHWGSGLCFLVIVAVSALAFVYTAMSSPFCRSIENWLLCGMLLTVSATALGFMGMNFAGKPNILLDCLLWLTAIVCISLSLYSGFITFCIITAVLCPPMEEYRFLEQLCNTEITLSDHSEGFSTHAMGFNRHGTRDIMMQCTLDKATNNLNLAAFPGAEEPTLELPVTDLTAACISGKLPMPKVCMYITSKEDSLGYKHLNLYDHLNLRSRVGNFLQSEPTAAAHAAKLTDAVIRQIETRRSETAVVAITVVLPKCSRKAASWAKGRGASIDESTSEDDPEDDENSLVSESAGYSMTTGASRANRRGYSKLAETEGTKDYSVTGTTSAGRKSASGYSLVEMKSQRHV